MRNRSNRRGIYLVADILNKADKVVATQEWMFAPQALPRFRVGTGQAAERRAAGREREHGLAEGLALHQRQPEAVGRERRRGVEAGGVAEGRGERLAQRPLPVFFVHDFKSRLEPYFRHHVFPFHLFQFSVGGRIGEHRLSEESGHDEGVQTVGMDL